MVSNSGDHERKKTQRIEDAAKHRAARRNTTEPQFPDGHPLSDASLLAVAVENSRAFEVLVNRYKAVGLRAANRVLWDEEESKDAVQTAWLNIWKSLPAIVPFKGSLRALFCTVVYRTAVSMRRKRTPNYDNNQAEAAVACSLTPYEILEASEFSDGLLAAFNELDPSTQEIVYLYHFADLVFREIAEMMELNTGVVTSRYYKGIAKLGRFLGDQEFR